MVAKSLHTLDNPHDSLHQPPDAQPEREDIQNKPDTPREGTHNTNNPGGHEQHAPTDNAEPEQPDLALQMFSVGGTRLILVHIGKDDTNQRGNARKEADDIKNVDDIGDGTPSVTTGDSRVFCDFSDIHCRYSYYRLGAPDCCLD